MMRSASEDPIDVSFASRVSNSLGRITFSYLDKTTVYLKTRWGIFLFLTAALVIRVIFLQGFYVVAYAWGIYLLNLLIGFVSPQIDPETEAYVLPVRDADEYRPFQRRIPEFQFWTAAMRATSFALFLTLFSAFDLPVFWPILLIYFLLLFIMTVKQQILHMMKYKYIPFNWGKQTYGDITRSKASKSSKESPSTFGVSSSGGAGNTRAGGMWPTHRD